MTAKVPPSSQTSKSTFVKLKDELHEASTSPPCPSLHSPISQQLFGTTGLSFVWESSMHGQCVSKYSRAALSDPTMSPPALETQPTHCCSVRGQSQLRMRGARGCAALRRDRTGRVLGRNTGSLHICSCSLRAEQKSQLED